MGPWEVLLPQQIINGYMAEIIFSRNFERSVFLCRHQACLTLFSFHVNQVIPIISEDNDHHDVHTLSQS